MQGGDMRPDRAGSPGAGRSGGLPVEAYALIGDPQTAALVGRNGSIDGLCLPRFDSGACFAALLGGEENGFWRIAPAGGAQRAVRRYRGETLVLETDFHTSDGWSAWWTACRTARTMPASSGWSRGSVPGARCAWTW